MSNPDPDHIWLHTSRMNPDRTRPDTDEDMRWLDSWAEAEDAIAELAPHAATISIAIRISLKPRT